MPYTTILFEVADGVAHITLNRPEAANAMNEQMAKELMNVALRCSEDKSIRAVLISGTGSMFCGGGDLKEFSAYKGEHLALHFKEMTTYLHAAISRWTRMDTPVVAAVHGSAAGAGMSLACACDIVVAAQSARFVLAYTRAGLTPDGSATYFLPRIVGLKRALDLALTNRVLSAQEALDWGIASRVVPDADLLAQARALAGQLAAGATTALRVSKRLLRNGWAETLETQMEHEAQGIAAIAHTSDAAEGIAAFLAKRPARFKGE